MALHWFGFTKIETEKIIPYFNQSIHVNSSKEFYNILPVSKDNTYLVECWIMDYETGGLIDSKTITINKEYIENILPNNGIFIKKWKFVK